MDNPSIQQLTDVLLHGLPLGLRQRVETPLGWRGPREELYGTVVRMWGRSDVALALLNTRGRSWYSRGTPARLGARDHQLTAS